MATDLGGATLVRNPDYERNGLKSYARALQKYGITPTVDGPYTGRLGEVPSTHLPASITSDGRHAIFDPAKSSTWRHTSGSWKITYGDQSTAFGTVGTDDLSIGGLVVRNQAIELATSVSRAFIDNKGDGLLGLSFSNNNSVEPFPVATPVENMILQDDIPPGSELFTTWLGNKLEPSFFTFGYIDEKALQGQTPVYTPVHKSSGSWIFVSNVASINGNYYNRPGNRALADTGTTLCLVEDSLCEQIYSAIPGARQSATQQGWIFPTPKDLATLPKIALSVGDALFSIKAGDFAFQELSDGTTYGGIQSRGHQDFDVLGCVFLRSIYAIFDQGNSRFGCTQRDMSPFSTLEEPSAHKGQLIELPPPPPSPTDTTPLPKPTKGRRIRRIFSLGCCVGESRSNSRSTSKFNSRSNSTAYQDNMSP